MDPVMLWPLGDRLFKAVHLHVLVHPPTSFPLCAAVGQRRTRGSICRQVDEVLTHAGRMAHLRKTGRDDIVANYNVKDRLAEYEKLWRGLLT